MGNRCKVLLDTVLLSVSCREDKLSIYVRSACILDLSYTSWVTKVSVPINIIIKAEYYYLCSRRLYHNRSQSAEATKFECQ